MYSVQHVNILQCCKSSESGGHCAPMSCPIASDASESNSNCVTVSNVDLMSGSVDVDAAGGRCRIPS